MGKFFVKGLMRLFGMLPLKVHYFNARWIAWLLRNVIGYRRDEVLINLTSCFPEKEYNELKQISKDFYLHFAELIVEAIWFGACRNPERLHKARMMEIANPGLLNELYEKYPSVMVMYSHTGNWELYGGIASYNYTDLPMHIREDNFCVVYRKLSSRMWDEILRKNRFAPLLDRDGFPGYIESKTLPRYVFSHRNEKKFYNVNTDQRPYYAAPSFIECDFLHHRVRTMSAAASLAAKFKMAVVYLNMNRTRQGHYLLEYTTLCEDASQMPVEAIMQQYYSLLEKDIRNNPANYLWTHRRFQQ